MRVILTEIEGKNTENLLFIYVTRLKNKIENNSIWEGAFYQSEGNKINSNWVIFIFYFMCDAAKARKLFCVAHLVNSESFFIQY